MARQLRYMPKAHTVFEITSRTVQGRHLLRPSKVLNDLILGIIGRAMRLYGVRVYLFVFLSNHYHLIASALDAETLSRFMCYLNGNLAKEAGRLHDWRERFWGRRYSAIAILEEGSLLDRVRYVLSQGCKEGLVLRPGDWPGVHCVGALVNGEKLAGRWVDRTRESEAKGRNERYDPKKFCTRYEVSLSPLSFVKEMSEGERRAFFRKMVRDIEAETRERLAQEKSKVMGRKRILAMDPHSYPKEFRRSPQPMCHALSKETMESYRRAYELFVEAYRYAQERFMRGDPDALSYFPDDCYIPPFVRSSAQARAAPG